MERQSSTRPSCATTMRRPAMSTDRCRCSAREFTVAEPPRVLITGPDSVAVGKPVEARRSPVRRSQTDRPDAALRNLPASSIRVLLSVFRPAPGKQLSRWRAMSPAAVSPVVFEAVSETDGKVIGESSPILIEARK